MIFVNVIGVCVLTFLVQYVVAEPPNFRILAPPFVCPKDKDAVIDKPDTTFITLQTDPDQNVKFLWEVRWKMPYAPTQHFTLSLWRTVRELEKKLNEPQIEPNVFIINNTQLLAGVSYLFSVTATTQDGATEQGFQIDNIIGDPKVIMEGQTDMFSIVLIGGQVTYADIDFILEAQVTLCHKTQDYYFVWTVTGTDDKLAVSDVKGSRLVIRANTLSPGQSYDVLCQVYKHSNGEFITQSSLPFRVIHREPSVNFAVDLLVILTETPFKISTDIDKLDYVNVGMTVAWQCSFDGTETIGSFYQIDDVGTLLFPSGLTYVGDYRLSLTVMVQGQSVPAKAIARAIASDSSLPIIQVHQMSRVLNEGSMITLKANVSNIAPGCSITWYFKSVQCLELGDSNNSDTCPDDEHGTAISDPVNFYSLEQNFLSELTDYTNETRWNTVSANLEAAAGRARVVAKCACVVEGNCTGDEEVYADVMFKLNERPTAGDVLVMPEIGTALETVFRLSTHAVSDPNRPMRYSFYCDLANNDTLLLGCYLEHTAVEVLLPYIEGGTPVWVEVCDSLGACSTGVTTTVPVAPGEARTVDALLDDVHAHVRRCELMMLRRLAASAIVTYTNADQPEALTKFTTSLLTALASIEERCIEKNYDQYNEFTYWLQNAGIDTTQLVSE